MPRKYKRRQPVKTARKKVQEWYDFKQVKKTPPTVEDLRALLNRASETLKKTVIAKRISDARVEVMDNMFLLVRAQPVYPTRPNYDDETDVINEIDELLKPDL